MTTKSVIASLCLTCLLGIAKAQNIPLFNDHLNMDDFKNETVPRSFDANKLSIPDGDGGIRDLRASPCYKEIGFNPDFSQEEIISMYEACEAEKRKKNIFTILVVLLCCGVIGLTLHSQFRKNQEVKVPKP